MYEPSKALVFLVCEVLFQRMYMRAMGLWEAGCARLTSTGKSILTPKFCMPTNGCLRWSIGPILSALLMVLLRGWSPPGASLDPSDLIIFIIFVPVWVYEALGDILTSIVSNSQLAKRSEPEV